MHIYKTAIAVVAVIISTTSAQAAIEASATASIQNLLITAFETGNPANSIPVGAPGGVTVNLFASFEGSDTEVNLNGVNASDFGSSPLGGGGVDAPASFLNSLSQTAAVAGYTENSFSTSGLTSNPFAVSDAGIGIDPNTGLTDVDTIITGDGITVTSFAAIGLPGTTPVLDIADGATNQSLFLFQIDNDSAFDVTLNVQFTAESSISFSNTDPAIAGLVASTDFSFTAQGTPGGPIPLPVGTPGLTESVTLTNPTTPGRSVSEFFDFNVVLPDGTTTFSLSQSASVSGADLIPEPTMAMVWLGLSGLVGSVAGRRASNV